MKPENLQDATLRWIWAALSTLLILSPLAALGCTRGSATPFTIEETYLLFESGGAPSSSGRSSVKAVLHYAGEAYRRMLALAEAGDVEGAMMALPDQDTLGDNLDRG